jgi:quinol monooxygenase YgiN
MATVGLLVKVEARPGKVTEVEAMLASVVDRVREEGLAVAWFGLRLGPATFAIFDAFTSEADRDAHLEANGDALRAAAAELFTGPPSIEYADVVAATLPGE